MYCSNLVKNVLLLSKEVFPLTITTTDTSSGDDSSLGEFQRIESKWTMVSKVRVFEDSAQDSEFETFNDSVSNSVFHIADSATTISIC
ncbi:hypothetical protein FQR65_LT08494 [Abscondita terminalis]|nr:hypothetical protein FQR65_LT08494 [Abscondita terminalis]